jgi:hypothetical protein
VTDLCEENPFLQNCIFFLVFFLHPMALPIIFLEHFQTSSAPFSGRESHTEAYQSRPRSVQVPTIQATATQVSRAAGHCSALNNRKQEEQ